MRTIEINKKKYPIKFGLVALKYFAKEKKIVHINKIESFFSKIDYSDLTFENIDDLSLLILCGLRNGARVEKSELDLTADDIMDLFESNPDMIENALAEYTDSIPEGGKEVNEKK